MMDIANEASGLLQFGVGGLAIGLGLTYIVRPLLAAAIDQNKRALDLLAESVEANRQAVELFRKSEEAQSLRMEQIISTKSQMLASITALHERLSKYQEQK